MTMNREIISTSHAPAAVGPYSQAVRVAGFIYTAGQIPLVPETGKMVEVLGMGDMIDPFQAQIVGRYHAGEEMPAPAPFMQTDLIFPSGEALPACWLDPDYRS